MRGFLLLLALLADRWLISITELLEGKLVAVLADNNVQFGCESLGHSALISLHQLADNSLQNLNVFVRLTDQKRFMDARSHNLSDFKIVSLGKLLVQIVEVNIRGCLDLVFR